MRGAPTGRARAKPEPHPYLFVRKRILLATAKGMFLLRLLLAHREPCFRSLRAVCPNALCIDLDGALRVPEGIHPGELRRTIEPIAKAWCRRLFTRFTIAGLALLTASIVFFALLPVMLKVSWRSFGDLSILPAAAFAAAIFAFAASIKYRRAVRLVKKALEIAGRVPVRAAGGEPPHAGGDRNSPSIRVDRAGGSGGRIDHPGC